VTTTPVTGSAPLTVTLTASCGSASYAWQFGDGSTATGQTVQHVYAAGYFRPTLTSDTGTEAVAPVTSISLRVSLPRRVGYAKYVALRAQIVPRLPVTFRGRRFQHGALRVRVLGPGPFVVHAGNVSASTTTVVVPTLTVAAHGAHVTAKLHPASAGHVVVPKVDAHATRDQRVVVRSKPARGWAPVAETVTVRALAYSVVALEERLGELHYAVIHDGRFGADDRDALYAFQKVEGLSRTGAPDATTWKRLLVAHTPRARYGGDHVEVDKARQVLFVVRGGQVTLIVPTSTGATGNTPLGVWRVYRKVSGFDWVLYYPSYFLRGFAVHGYPDVPPYPASHGCARIPMWIATTVYAQMAPGSTVYVYV
jgi:peptidoglycan hydrolase-like protein with peptidoglycan-binding domain